MRGSVASAVVHDLVAPLRLNRLPWVDAIVHLAQANTKFPDGAADLLAVNTVRTQELLEHARRCGTSRFIFTSSGSVYGKGPLPFSETDPLVPHDFYAVTKIAAEHLVAVYGELVPTTVLRLFTPYGPGQEGRLIPVLIDRVRRGKAVTLNGDGSPRLNPVYVEDVITVIIASLESDESELLNVSGDEVVGIRELTETIGALLGVEPRFECGHGNDRGDIVADNTKLHRIFPSHRLITLREGLERMT
jgi:nucleoside-diphosphate-sugar epimerase